MLLGKWTALCKRVKLEYFLIPYTKTIWKWVKYLNIRPETIKLLKENKSRTLDDINQSKILYDPPPRVMEIKTKVTSGTWLNLKAFAQQRKLKQGEKTTLRIGENNSKWNSWQRINIQNMQAAHTTQWQKNTTQSKSGERPKQTFLQRRHTDG